MTHPLAHLNPDCVVLDDLLPLARNLKRLAHYCEVRHRAIRDRLDGKIAEALKAEQFCQILFDKLPDEWRW